MEIDKVVHKTEIEDKFIYRDTIFYKSQRTLNGYWGAYIIGNKSFSYRWEVTEYIDNKIDRR